MILTVIIENSKIYLGAAEPETGHVIFENAISADLRKTTTEYLLVIRQLLDLHGIQSGSVEGCIISSCVPQLTDVIRRALAGLVRREIMEVAPGLKTGVNIRTDDPSELGADLITAAAAGIRHYGAPLIIVNFGTTTTISFIDEQKAFRGCTIAPGVRLSLESLAGNTAFLPDVAAHRPAHLIGTNTADSMQSGVIIGMAAMIDGMIDRFREETELDAEVVAAGEYAGLVIPYCRHMIMTDEHLLMKGLLAIYNRNRRKIL